MTMRSDQQPPPASSRPPPPCRRRPVQRFRSLTEASMSSSSFWQDSMHPESESTPRGHLGGSGTLVSRRNCMESCVDQRMGGGDEKGDLFHQVTPFVRVQQRGHCRLRKSISLPANLDRVVMVSTDQWKQPFEQHPLDFHPIAENATVDVLSLDESVVTSSDEGSSRQGNHQEERKVPVTQVTMNDTPPVSTLVIAPQDHFDLEKTRLIDLLHAESWFQVECLCEEVPDVTRQEIVIVIQGERCKALALHLACSIRTTPLSVVDALVTANPSSILKKESRQGRLAIHMAALKGASPAVCRYLGKAMPSCLQVQDTQGNLPIHYAAMCGTNETLEVLLQASKNTCRVANFKNKLPLHMLCTRWVDEENHPISIQVFQKMIQAYPDSIAACDAHGRLPIHVACNMRHPRLDVIQLLLSYKPSTCLQKDGDKKIPLQLAKRFSSQDGDLCIAFLQDVTHHESQVKTKKAAMRMARRLFHFGRKL